MMTVGSVDGTPFQGANNSMQTDSISKNIQKQIANAQKRLQELSSKKDMTPEEKMKKRQEIQQEITSLNQQLRQHQIELRKEQQSKGTSMDDMLGGNQNAKQAKQDSKGSGLSQASMQAMISADSSMKQAQVQGGVATEMEGRARVLESELKMDKKGGASTERKEGELASLRQKAVDATASQMSALVDANKTIKEADKAEETDTKSGSETDKADKSGREKDGIPGDMENEADTSEQPDAYIHVDVRL